MSDIFNSQFTLQHYFDINEIDLAIFDFAESNKIDINYICFAKQAFLDTYYILTTNLDALPKNGFRFITVIVHNALQQSNIIDYKKHGTNFLEYNISYNNVNITISKQFLDLDVLLSKMQPNILACHSANILACHSANISKLFPIIKSSGVNYEEALRLYVGHSTRMYVQIIENETVLESIALYHKYNKNINIQNVKRILDANLSILSVLNYYDCFITTIYFDDNFNTAIKPGELPQYLKYLVFGTRYNKVIEINVLPESLTKLVFGYYYDQELDENAIPKSLKKIEFGWRFTKNISFANTNLIEILFTRNYMQYLELCDLPKSLEAIFICKTYLPCTDIPFYIGDPL